MEKEREHMTTKFVLRAGAAFVALLSGCMAYSQQPAPAAGTGRGAAAQRPRVVSPEILPDNKVTFRLLAPKAETVVVNGNWDNGLNIPMTKDDQGIWSTTVGPMTAQLWGYYFSVDGVKVLDPGVSDHLKT